jgi:hypothetical protein
MVQKEQRWLRKSVIGSCIVRSLNFKHWSPWDSSSGSRAPYFIVIFFITYLFLVLLLLTFTYLTILILVFIIPKKLGVRCAPINQFMLDSFYDLIQAPKPWVQSEGKSSNQQELWLAHNTQQYGELWIVTSKLYESINSAPL